MGHWLMLSTPKEPTLLLSPPSGCNSSYTKALLTDLDWCYFVKTSKCLWQLTLTQCFHDVLLRSYWYDLAYHEIISFKSLAGALCLWPLLKNNWLVVQQMSVNGTLMEKAPTATRSKINSDLFPTAENHVLFLVDARRATQVISQCIIW